ncbi:TPA: hypothetical protein ACUNF5_006381 [Burkholderia orbicola]|uniref:hypothetical protein n=1 Tax=Burkholderia orbicola TaxID=2978683 RepID=UPI00264B1302|nr:hypothetical protein [Burkholderia orbicola]MDN7535413.1 hypothetical protein [Burkholderia orbicola]
MIPLRFRRPVNDARPFGVHRFDVFGPKVGCPLTLYGLNALHLWLRLEANSRVTTYCERPLRIPDTRPTRAVDFWVGEEGQEILMIVLRASEVAAVAKLGTPFPAFEAWSRSHSMVLRTIRPDELDDPEVLRRNRLTMLCYLAASAYECCDVVAPDILGACRDGLTLSQLEHRLAPLDPTVSRAAAFKLVLSDALYGPTLATQSLGLRSVLVTR